MKQQQSYRTVIDEEAAVISVIPENGIFGSFVFPKCSSFLIFIFLFVHSNMATLFFSFSTSHSVKLFDCGFL